MTKKSSAVVVSGPSKNLTNPKSMRENLALVKEDFTKGNQKVKEFERVQKEYKKANFIVKMFSQGELRDAQLNAIQGTADMTRVTCKLIQALAITSDVQIEQQESIQHEQQELKRQGKRIEEMTKSLGVSQAQLSAVNEDLKKAIAELFEIKGLTHEEAKKLIGVRKKVENVEKTIAENHAALATKLDNEYSELRAKVEQSLQRESEQIQELHSLHKSSSKKIKIYFGIALAINGIVVCIHWP
jgi:hypothetical protein